MWKFFRRPLPRAFLMLAVLFGALGGCYMPVKFDAEISIDRRGFYKIDFAGYLARVQLYAEMREGKLSPDEEREKIDIILRDLKRDKAVTVAEHYGKGIFRVEFKDEGDLLKSKMVTFLRRNEKILSLDWSKISRQVTVHGAAIREADRERLVEIGLGMEGQLRIRTNARVADHNANEIKRDGMENVYIWNIKGLQDKAPKLVIPF